MAGLIITTRARGCTKRVRPKYMKEYCFQVKKKNDLIYCLKLCTVVRGIMRIGSSIPTIGWVLAQSFNGNVSFKKQLHCHGNFENIIRIDCLRMRFEPTIHTSN